MNFAIRHTIRNTLTVTLTLLSPCACLAAKPPTTLELAPTKEVMPMTTEPLSVKPLITAEVALKRLLDMIRAGKPVAEFTPEWVGEAMGVPITWASDGDKRYGFGSRVAPQWTIGFGVDFSGVARGKRPRFELDFNPYPSSIRPAMTDICHLDFNQFTAQLEAMGYIRESHYDSSPPSDMGQSRLPHGRLMYDSFNGPEMYIEVYPAGESTARADHDCVKMLFIY